MATVTEGSPHGNGNGHADAFVNDAREDTPGAGKPEPQAPTYPCPDILRQGVFADVADKLGLWSWEVWCGTFGALCARAQRNLHCHYYSSFLYGNSYVLLVAPTGAGKDIVLHIPRALLRDPYKIRSGLNSGPALVPLLTDASLKNTEGRLEVAGCPVLLLCAEWSRLAQMGGIEHATLQEDVNDMHMRHYPWTQTRSHKSTSGGDIVITDPTLTIVGTTTRALFAKSVDDKALSSGTLNRYLIVPGSATFQPYTGKSYRTDNTLAGLIDHLTTHTFGLGQEIAEFYNQEAWDAFDAFQHTVLLPMQNDPGTSEALKRLHLHFQHVCALYAWQTQSPYIMLAHVQAAQAVITTSKTFVEELLEERAKSFEPTKIQEVEAGMERRVIAKLKATPGLTRRECARQLSQKKVGYAAWAKIIDALLKAEALRTTLKGKREELSVHPGV